ncbi:MAG: TlpA disulfide reductase family protein [Mariprofundaceae bacterium]
MKRTVILLALGLMLAAIPHAWAGDFQWQDTSGSKQQLADVNKPVALHFWATWCIPCRGELPELAAWKHQHPDVNLIAISLDRKMEQVTEFLGKEKLELPALLARSSDTARFGVRGLPSTVILSADGGIKKIYTGPVPWNNADFTKEFFALMQP